MAQKITPTMLQGRGELFCFEIQLLENADSATSEEQRASCKVPISFWMCVGKHSRQQSSHEPSMNGVPVTCLSLTTDAVNTLPLLWRTHLSQTPAADASKRSTVTSSVPRMMRSRLSGSLELFFSSVRTRLKRRRSLR